MDPPITPPAYSIESDVTAPSVGKKASSLVSLLSAVLTLLSVLFPSCLFTSTGAPAETLCIRTSSSLYVTVPRVYLSVTGKPNLTSKPVFVTL